MHGLALSAALLTCAVVVLFARHLRDRADRLEIPCPFCHGQGVIPVGHPSGDPQLDSERDCPDCGGDARLTAGEIRASRAADAVADRIERAVHAAGFQTVVSHYPGMPRRERWEVGALRDGHVIAGPVTGETRLTAINALAGELRIDVRRIPS